MLGSGMNLATTVIGFGMSSTFIVFVCARLICGRSRPVDSEASVFNLELPPERRNQQPENEDDGLEPIVLAAIPTIKYNRQSFHSREDQCIICLGEYQERDLLRIMPKCGHNFHLSCIDIWLQKHSTCPICRLSLYDSLEINYVAVQAINRQDIHRENMNQVLLQHNQQHHGSSQSNIQDYESLSEVVGFSPGEETGARR
ncbi:RING-H2 finger protein ATL5-like isoform X2 [Typha angustifolia]|uniref:RING-H2 finger protein ATL5-like isoform X2 n=1 Tax=Typha angustifolia TaxID=59011 RepID=UPI003C2AFF51